jgi:hypothetical protein
MNGEQYLSGMANLAPAVLQALLARGEPTRDAITEIEQIIQDFLRAVFLPFVGQSGLPNYIAEKQPRQLAGLRPMAEAVRREEMSINFIGAHYRSQLSIRGRRTAFASRRTVFAAALKERVRRRERLELGKTSTHPAFQQLWDAVYLEQYFRLCGVEATVSEWALHQRQPAPIAILATKERSCFFAPLAVAGMPSVPTIGVPAGLTGQLLPPGHLRHLWQAVGEAILQARTEMPGDFERFLAQSDERPEQKTIRTRLRLLHRANVLAARRLDRTGLRAELAARAAYVAGLVLFGNKHRALRDGLRNHLGTPPHLPGKRLRTDSDAHHHLHILVGVLQSLRFYQDCYGEGCITIPQELAPAANGDAAGGAGKKWNAANPGSQCSLTLFWSRHDTFPPILPAILAATPDLLRRALSAAEEAAKTPEAPAAKLSPAAKSTVPSKARPAPPSPPQSLAMALQKESGDLFDVDVILKILNLCEDLSRFLHEHEPRAFTLLLGSPQWLIADLHIEHELVGAEVPFLVTSQHANPASYASTLSLLEGNSSFLQADDLAFFVAWPGAPLELTHIVRLPPLAAGRRKLLCRFTAGRHGLLAVATHGNGRGELIYNGRVKGVLRGGRTWTQARDYDRFAGEMCALLKEVVKNETNMRSVRTVLQAVVRDLSEEPRVGALFVVAAKEAIEDLRAKSARLTDVLESVDGQRLSEMSPEVLHQLARDDGATLICGHSLQVWGRLHLPTYDLPSPQVLEARWTDKGGGMYWPHWYKTKTWGTRRWTGLAVSRELKDRGVVIAISTDGPIDVLKGGFGAAEYSE